MAPTSAARPPRAPSPTPLERMQAYYQLLGALEAGDAPGAREAPPPDRPLCRYGAACRRPGCTFGHPGHWRLPRRPLGPPASPA